MLPAIEAKPAELRTYAGERVHCELLEPEDTDELVSMLQVASRARRRVTFRGHGQSLDTQSLNTDLVIGLRRLTELEFAEDPVVVSVGAGVSTGELARAAFARGVFPAVLVTTSSASIAGTVSSNCVSRFTPTRGQEGDHVLGLELVTPQGERLRCSRDHEADVFHGVIGGLGYLGCITRVTLELDPGAR
ncbi:MAG TPA: FAD-binding protein, partial [Polyangiaceae bacterium]|nr:FAD-binding protein [Polyangiaceae bacterium]